MIPVLNAVILHVATVKNALDENIMKKINLIGLVLLVLVTKVIADGPPIFSELLE